MSKKVKNKETRVGVGKLLIWNSRMIATTFATLMYGFLMIYCTDTLKIEPILVSGMLLASKVADGVTDLFAGFIVDKTQTKWGKARPYEVFVVLLCMCKWLMFSCPAEWSTTVKCVWVFIMYTLANAVCYTFLNANSTPYLVRAFKGEQIVKVTSYGSIIPMLAGFVFNIVFPITMAQIASSPAGWSRLVAFWMVPAALIGILRMLFVEEKYEVESEEKKKEKIRFRHVIELFRTDKYILLIVLMQFVFNFVTTFGANTYYYTYIVKNVGLMGIVSAITFIAIPLAFIFPKLINRFSTAKLMMAGLIISATGYLLNFFAGANIPLLMIGQLLTGAGSVPASMLIALCIVDCAEYNEYKGVHRMEGTMSSVVGLGQKVGSAIGGSILGVVLTFAGYTGAAETLTDSVLLVIRLMYSLVPMVLFVATALCLTGYLKLDKKLPEIRKENEARRAAQVVKADSAEQE